MSDYEIPMEILKALKEENARLRDAIAHAPCGNYEGKGNGTCSDCECWKRKALEQNDE